MRQVFILSLALVASGCAAFGGGDRAAFDSREKQPIASMAQAEPARRAERAAFTPAFDVGSPVALVPCRSKATVGGNCRSLNDRHQVSGEISRDLDARPLDEAALRPTGD
jgi:hypothetical protein